MQRVKSNLHVVVCFSPLGSLYRQRYRQFPALFTCTTMSWFHGWPKDALISVATSFLQDADVGSSVTQELLPFHMVRNVVAVVCSHSTLFRLNACAVVLLVGTCRRKCI